MSHNSEKKIIYEMQQIEKELSVVITLNKIDKVRSLDDIELRAMASALQSIYNGIEKILVFRLGDFKSQGTGWHSELLEKSKEENVISMELESHLRKLMGFRHFYRHSYGFMLKENQLKPLYKAVPEIIELLKNNLNLET